MSVIQQNLDKITVFAGVATAAKTSTATSSAIDLLEYDGDILLILDCAAGTLSLIHISEPTRPY